MTSTLWTGLEYIPAPRFALGDAVMTANEAWDEWEINDQETLYCNWYKGHIIGAFYDLDGETGCSIFPGYRGWRYIVAIVEAHDGHEHRTKSGWEEFIESELRACQSLARDSPRSALACSHTS